MLAHSSEEISELLRLLYQAAADLQLWPNFLQNLIQKVGAERGAFVQHQLKPGIVDHSSQSSQLFHVGYSPEAVHLYNTHYGTDDPYARGFRQRKLNLRVGLCDDLVDHAAMRRTAFYNDYARRFDIFYLCWIAFTDPAQHVALSLVRSEKYQPFGLSQLELLSLLTPHVEQAMRLNRMLGCVAGEAATAKKSVEAFALAVITLDGNGRVITLSSRAEFLLKQESGLRMRNHQLMLDDPIAQSRFRILVDGALRTATGRGLERPILTREIGGKGKAHLEIPTSPSGGAIRVRRGREPFTIQVIVYPFHSDSVLQEDKPSALIFLSEPTPKTRGYETLLREMYGLTNAEARLAALIGAAMPLQEAVNCLHITMSTARDRLKQIFRKTEMSRQAELVSLLSRLPRLES